MRNIYYFLILVSFNFLVSGCEENGIFFPSNSSSQGNGTFQVTFDGNTFSTTSADFTTDREDIVINAVNPNTNEIFTLSVKDFDINSYSFEGQNNVASYIKNDPVSADIWSTFDETTSRGNIEFTHIDFVNNTVSGTFNFIGKNLTSGSSKAFTNGSFTNIPKADLLVTNNTFAAKVNGVVYEEISLFGNLVSLGGNDLILISANKSLTETIGITLPSNISAGNYDFASFTSLTEPTAQYTVGGSTYVGDGKIVITNYDKTTKFISGTFQFEASPITSNTPNFSITEGEFNVSY